jgi:hypothetical protein
VPVPSPRARLIAKAVGAISALALLASSVGGLLSLDGRLQGAVSAERQAPAGVTYDVESRKHHGDCPYRDRRDEAPRVRL